MYHNKVVLPFMGLGHIYMKLEYVVAIQQTDSRVLIITNAPIVGERDTA